MHFISNAILALRHNVNLLKLKLNANDINSRTDLVTDNEDHPIAALLTHYMRSVEPLSMPYTDRARRTGMYAAYWTYCISFDCCRSLKQSSTKHIYILRTVLKEG